MNINKSGSKPFIYILILLFALCYNRIYGQDNLSLSASIQMIGGNLSDSSSQSRSYYLYGGIKYQAQDYSLSLTIPIVATGNQGYTQVGGMFIPNNNNNGNPGSQMHGGSSHNSMMSGGTLSTKTYNYGIGDMYLYGDYNIYSDNENLTKITLNGYIKFPTATSSLNIGTGKFDLNLGAGLKKIVGEYLFYGQIGYLMLGKDSGSNLKNPFTFDLGLGKSFEDGKHLLMISYESYTTIIEGITSPKQIALGYSYMFSPSVSYIIIGTMGLSNSISNYSLFGGINFNI